MTWLFTQVWLWSLAAFVLGALLSWLLFVPRLRRQVRWLRAELAEVPEDEDLPPERDGVGWLTPEPAERLDEEVGFGRWDRGPRDWDRARMYGSTERFGPVRSAHEGTEPEVEVPVEQPPAAEQDDSELRLEVQREAGSSGRAGAPDAGGPNAAGSNARGQKGAGPGTTTPKPGPPKPAEDPTAPAEGEITDTELVEHPPEPESTENTWFRKPDLPEAPEDEWTGVLEPEPAPVTNGHALSGEIDVDEVRPELPKRLPGVGPRPGPSEVSGVRIPGEPRKTGPPESVPSESGPPEGGSSGGGPSEGQSSETGPSEIGSSETGPSETGPSGRGLFEPGKTETGSSETAESEKGQSEKGQSETSGKEQPGTAAAGTGPAEPGPSGASQSATGQATAGQPGTGRAGSGQPTADQPTAAQPEPPPLPRAPELPTGPGRTEPSRAGMVKGHFASHRYHTPDSPEYGEIDPDVWFRTAADAEQAGFEPWDGSGRA